MAIITDGVRTKFTDDNGLPLIGGQVFSYVEGTSTPKDTYQDRAFTIPNTNPIILDDVGSCQMYLKGGYRLRVLTADGVLVEEKDNAFQSDGQVLDVVANTTAIAALQTNVDVLNTRGGLKIDANNHIIGQGKAESATVYDLSLRSDKVRVSAPTDVEFGDLIFKTYDAPTVANGVTIPKGTWLNPALVMPLLGTAATKDDSRYVKADTTGAVASSIKVTDRSLLTTASLSHKSMAMADFFNDGAIGYSAGLVFRTFTDSAVVLSHSGARSLVYTKVTGMKASGYNTIATGEVLVAGINAKADGNGFYKTSSPTIDVYADKIIANDEANEQNPTFKRSGVGDYTITTQTGLSTDGWYIELPKDMNGNPKVAVTLSEVDGVISLKSYKRVFSMETFTFEPDLDNPLDIPDGRWIDLRLNEMPSEPTQQSTP